jgi:hypothetical protein
MAINEGFTVSEQQTKEPMLYLDWFLDQYEIGLPDISLLQQNQAYLQGLIDAKGTESVGYLLQIQSSLRSAEVMIRTLKQYKVRMPHG